MTTHPPGILSTTGHTSPVVDLHLSDFRQFSSSAPYPSLVNESSWWLPEPAQGRHDGRLAVDDLVSRGSYSLEGFSFSARFLAEIGPGSPPSEFGDELVVFATSEVATYHGYEFGVRAGLADGGVYGYAQFPQPQGGVAFQETRLFGNDGRTHSYDLSIAGTSVTFRVDGILESTAHYPVPLPGGLHIVGTAHRASDGWAATGVGLYFGQVSLRLASA